MRKLTLTYHLIDNELIDNEQMRIDMQEYYNSAHFY